MNYNKEQQKNKQKNVKDVTLLYIFIYIIK